ncbi:EGF-like domain-containing protein 2 [Haliotis rufescens]|uniref:EGF-like domain-containing protein 2 n=1 Tax=Haliotis rufescens TaxID=6454 RepID=UPI001EB000AE|nr:EGF-like domain-containing protein 2 [Haliotis rufescens]
MMRVTLCLMISFCLGSVSALFDCARETGSCQNGGTCDMAAGTCSCDASYTGYDCSVVIADQADAACTTNPCINGGTCHKAGAASAATCLCAPDYVGATCEDKRYMLTCDTAANPDTMTMKVVPHVSSFSGKVYHKNKETPCPLAETATGTGVYMSTAVAIDDATCGATTTGTNSVQEIIIQFGTDTLTTRDELITFTCGTSDEIAQSSGAVTIQNVESNLGTKDVSNVPLDADIDLTLTSGGSSASGATLDLGADILVTVALTTPGSAKFAAIRLTRCYAANEATSGAGTYKSRDFITASCPAADLKSVMLVPVAGPATSKTFTFDAFKFTGSDTLFVTCDIKACAVSTDCDPVTCSRRKKREAGTSPDKVLQRSFNINDPLALATAAATLNEFKENKACYLTWEMTATVVALAVALLLLLILCIVLVVKAILHRRDTTGNRDDTSDTNSTAQLPHLPTLVSNKC